MTKKTILPTAIAVDRAMKTLLEGEYWPTTLSTEGAYVRRHDDTNGETGIEQELAVTFSPDGDAWIMLPGMTSLRFRTWAGGGMSLRVRKGLMVLAEAIRRDNAERPQHDLSEGPAERVAELAAAPSLWQVQIRAGDEWRAVTTWDHGHTIKNDTFIDLGAALEKLAVMERNYDEHSFRAHPINRTGRAA